MLSWTVFKVIIYILSIYPYQLTSYFLNKVTPDAVTDLVVGSSSYNSLTLKWSHPSIGDMPVTSYKLEYKEAVDGATTKTSITSASSHVITGLKPYTNYTIRVMAKSRVGEGLWSAPIEFTTDQAGKQSSHK